MKGCWPIFALDPRPRKTLQKVDVLATVDTFCFVKRGPWWSAGVTSCVASPKYTSACKQLHHRCIIAEDDASTTCLRKNVIFDHNFATASPLGNKNKWKTWHGHSLFDLFKTRCR